MFSSYSIILCTSASNKLITTSLSSKSRKSSTTSGGYSTTRPKGPSTTTKIKTTKRFLSGSATRRTTKPAKIKDYSNTSKAKRKIKRKSIPISWTLSMKRKTPNLKNMITCPLIRSENKHLQEHFLPRR